MRLRIFMWRFTRYSQTAYRTLEILEAGGKSLDEIQDLLGCPRVAFRLAILHLAMSGFITASKMQIQGEPKRFGITPEGHQFYHNAEREKDVLTRRTVYRIGTVRYE